MTVLEPDRAVRVPVNEGTGRVAVAVPVGPVDQGLSVPVDANVLVLLDDVTRRREVVCIELNVFCCLAKVALMGVVRCGPHFGRQIEPVVGDIPVLRVVDLIVILDVERLQLGLIVGGVAGRNGEHKEWKNDGEREDVSHGHPLSRRVGLCQAELSAGESSCSRGVRAVDHEENVERVPREERGRPALVACATWRLFPYRAAGVTPPRGNSEQ